ncbi:MAG: DUF2333 family protein [Dissulfuribacterales bacterium]
MADTPNNAQTDNRNKGFQAFLWIRIIGGLVVAIALIWGFMKLLDYVNPSGKHGTPEILYSAKSNEATMPYETPGYNEETKYKQILNESKTPQSTDIHQTDAKNKSKATHAADADHSATKGPTGVAFIEALITPLEYELTERFWGWRPNDIIQFTDNINEYQLGVLEVTRRATTRLTENISRTGSTAVINKYLERAMNSFMIRADRYLFPSAENQYRQAIENLNRFKAQLINNEASFYTRTDNLIPLLQSMVELVGSCDEKLVKTTEDNGKPVSTFAADNYYYYSKGVASALLPILHAIKYDFNKVLETRSGSEILHHAIVSCHHAAEMKPWLFVTEGNLNGIFANHRANMATAISHARFYLGLLIVTLST